MRSKEPVLNRASSNRSVPTLQQVLHTDFSTVITRSGVKPKPSMDERSDQITHENLQNEIDTLLQEKKFLQQRRDSQQTEHQD